MSVETEDTMREEAHGSVRESPASGSTRSVLYVALGAGLLGMGMLSKSRLGRILAAVGGASLCHGLSDWLGRQTRRAGGFGTFETAIEQSLSDEAVMEAQAVAAFEQRPSSLGSGVEADDVSAGDQPGWAPESGEPDEQRAGFQRGEASSVAGDDEGLAPESGERYIEPIPHQARPEPQRFEESAAEYRVEEGSEESFPASDVPSWVPGRT